MPYNEYLFTEKNSPNTNFSSGIFFQQRPDYTRYLGNLSLTYEWRETPQKKHQLTPMFLNLVRIFPDSLFSKKIEQLSQPLQSSYKDHLFGGARWSYTFTNQKQNKSKNYILLHSNIEVAGNLFRLMSKKFAGASQGETFYLFGVRFGQYAKFDFDFRQYFNIDKDRTFVYRYFMGFGIPYGNIEVLPFDKRYSASGSNDIRAWKFRSLGPGNYYDDNSFDKTGDMAIVANIEYRFPIYDIVQSAIFVDAGNIWMIKDYEDFPNGSFDLNNFHKQIALGAGLGIRLNFGFFVFRFDAGMPIHDPGMLENQRWLKFKEARKKTNLNFGIGYPF